MIHGLWPNYVNGYPHCCEKAAAVPLTTGNNATFNPELFPSKIYKEMQQHWSDPTTTQQNCELWNHEWYVLCIVSKKLFYDILNLFFCFINTNKTNSITNSPIASRLRQKSRRLFDVI